MHQNKIFWRMACSCVVVVLAACGDSKKSTVCSEGEACNPELACHAGTISCSGAAPQCVPTAVANGTACGAAQVCYDGQCLACQAGQTCQAEQACHAGSITCDSGAPVCVETPLADGTACGDLMVCGAGECVCASGAACQNTPCRTATVSCAAGSPACVDNGGLEPDNLECGEYLVCRTGDCVCNAGGACPGTACSTGEISCAGGVATCVQTAFSDGTSCGDASRCITGSCTPCADIAGPWYMTQQLAGGTCTSHLTDHVTYVIAQDGCEILVTDGANDYEGEVLGDTVSWDATVPRDGGSLTITDMALTANTARTAMTGSAAWSWTNGSTTCTGTLTLEGGPGAVNPRQTGQTTCFEGAVPFAEIDCAGTGQDGETRKGTPWPSPRFVTIPEQGGILVDKLTGLHWMASPTPASGPCTIASTKTWQGALDQAACLNNIPFLGRSTWRLPNVNELASLIHFGEANSATWLNGQGFTGIATAGAAQYWTSTTHLRRPSSSTPISAWCVRLASGGVVTCAKTEANYVWLVSDSTAHGVSLAKTGQTSCYADDDTVLASCAGTGQDGELQKGIAWPNPRFTNVDGSAPATGALIHDQLTGLTWLSGNEEVSECGSVTEQQLWSEALSFAACLRSVHAQGYDDWRLANAEELRGLVDYGQSVFSTWLHAQGFSEAITGNLRSSDSDPGFGITVWVLYGSTGMLVPGWNKAEGDMGAMFVRGGR